MIVCLNSGTFKYSITFATEIFVINFKNSHYDVAD